MPDLFFYRDPEEAEKEEAAREEAAVVAKQADFVAPPAKEEWGGEELTAPVTDWSADGTAAAPVEVVPAVPIAAPAAAFQVTEDWAAQTESSDWAAQSAPAGEGAAPNANTWGGSGQW